jgi:hypothetical protein
MTKRYLLFSPSLFLLLIFQGCEGVPKDALRMNEATVEQRRLQTKTFETADEAKILSASAALLQDLGFTLDKSETKVGLIVASKDRSAADAGQVTGALVKGFLFGAYAATYDQKQKIRASVVTHPSFEGTGKMAVRVTFQRIVWNNREQITKLERMNDTELYTGFFDKLSKAVFLEAHDI